MVEQIQGELSDLVGPETEILNSSESLEHLCQTDEIKFRNDAIRALVSDIGLKGLLSVSVGMVLFGIHKGLHMYGVGDYLSGKAQELFHQDPLVDNIINNLSEYTSFPTAVVSILAVGIFGLAFKTIAPTLVKECEAVYDTFSIPINPDRCYSVDEGYTRKPTQQQREHGKRVYPINRYEELKNHKPNDLIFVNGVKIRRFMKLLDSDKISLHGEFDNSSLPGYLTTDSKYDLDALKGLNPIYLVGELEIYDHKKIPSLGFHSVKIIELGRAFRRDSVN